MFIKLISTIALSFSALFGGVSSAARSGSIVESKLNENKIQMKSDNINKNLEDLRVLSSGETAVSCTYDSTGGYNKYGAWTFDNWFTLGANGYTGTSSGIKNQFIMYNGSVVNYGASQYYTSMFQTYVLFSLPSDVNSYLKIIGKYYDLSGNLNEFTFFLKENITGTANITAFSTSNIGCYISPSASGSLLQFKFGVSGVKILACSSFYFKFELYNNADMEGLPYQSISSSQIYDCMTNDTYKSLFYGGSDMYVTTFAKTETLYNQFVKTLFSTSYGQVKYTSHEFIEDVLNVTVVTPTLLSSQDNLYCGLVRSSADLTKITSVLAVSDNYATKSNSSSNFVYTFSNLNGITSDSYYLVPCFSDGSIYFTNSYTLSNSIVCYFLNYTWTSFDLEVPVNTKTEVVDIPGLMFIILSLPFSFFSGAFDLTLFSGTAYAINVADVVLCILGLLIIIFVVRLVIKIIRMVA